MKRCRNCLLYEGMTLWLHPRTLPEAVRPIRIDATGVCSACAAYAAATVQIARHRAHVSTLLAGAKKAVALYSGGKDSTAMLVLARKRLGLDVSAVLFDNGFIPQAVLDNAATVCARLDVALRVVRETESVRAALKIVDLDQETPCVACANHTFRAAVLAAMETEATLILQGTNYFARWETTPQASFHVQLSHGRTHIVNLPYALGQRRQDTLAVLRSVDYEPHHLSGISSNCLVPGVVQTKLADRLGHVPELEDAALEVMVGHISRDEAIAELRHKAPEHLELLEN